MRFQGFVLASLAVSATMAAVPAGTALFYEGECPIGWIEDPLARGRMIVSVVNGSRGGFTVNEPLSDMENRGHSHTTLASTSFPTKSVSAVDGSDHTAAAQGSQHGANKTELGGSGLGFVQLRLCVTVNAIANVTLPAEAVAFFGPDIYECPVGFLPLDDSAGRALIPGHSTDITKSDAAPLADQEDRGHSHVHDNGQCSVTTQSTDFEGVGGCCNDSPSADGTYAVAVTSGESTTGLPYIQMLTCGSSPSAEDEAPVLEGPDLPDGALFFSTSELGCPQGWEPFVELGGRFPVANPNGGTAGSTFGGNPVPSSSATGVPHAHDITGAIVTRPAGIELIQGCCAKGYAESGVYEYACATDDTQSVDFPYLMAPLCRRSPAAHALRH